MSEQLELNESMTSDEIASYAEAVVKEVAQERQGDVKSDAEIVTSVAAVEKTSAESNSSTDDSVEAENQDEETGDDSQTPEWLSDDVKAEAAAYGIDEDDLSDFASREELDKVLRLFDKKALDAGRKAMAEGEDKTRNEKGRFVKKEATEDDSKEPSDTKKSSDRYEVSLSKDLYDDEIVNEFTRLRDHYEARMERLEANFIQAAVRSDEERFDNFVDSIGHSDLFGKTGKESSKELERRAELRVAVKAHMIGMENLGRPVEYSDKLVDRVANMVFAEELGKKRLKQHTQKISRQNQLRQGGSPTKPQPVSDHPRDVADRLYRELEKS